VYEYSLHIGEPRAVGRAAAAQLTRPERMLTSFTYSVILGCVISVNITSRQDAALNHDKE
jgi:hypothetical protein